MAKLPPPPKKKNNYQVIKIRNDFTFQVFPTFIVAGLGMVGAGLVLSYVQVCKELVLSYDQV